MIVAVTNPTCTICYRRAVIYAIGRYRNGAEARQPRCDRHAPDLERDAGCTLLDWADRPFVLKDIVRVL